MADIRETEYLHLKVYKSDTEELRRLLHKHNLPFEQFQLGQYLVRAMLISSPRHFGGFNIERPSRLLGLRGQGNTVSKSVSPFEPSKNWWESLERIKFEIDQESRHLENAFEDEKYVFGTVAYLETKNSYVRQMLELWKEHTDLLERMGKGPEGARFILKSDSFQMRSKLEQRFKELVEGDKMPNAKERLIYFDKEKNRFVYQPQNHPYYYEYVLFNFCVFSLFFNSDRIHLNGRTSNKEVVEFIADKILWEHTAKEKRGDNDFDFDEETQRQRLQMLKDHFSLKRIQNLVKNNSSFKNNVAIVHKEGRLLTKELVAWTVRNREDCVSAIGKSFKGMTNKNDYFLPHEIEKAGKYLKSKMSALETNPAKDKKKSPKRAI